MGGGPTIETVRAGVQFTPEAAASFRRAEADLGRRIDVNRTYADWDTQLAMYNAWQAWVAGRGPKPNHSRALHPMYSYHCKALALDSDDWRTPGFNEFMADRGWIRTAAHDPTEQHHYEYQWWRDSHRDRPAGGITAGKPDPTTPKDEDMLKPRLFQIDPNVDGRWVLADYQAGTYWQIRNGLQLDDLKTDPDVKVLSGPQVPDFIAGLRAV